MSEPSGTRPVDPGDKVRVEMSKWGDHPHWEFEGVFLGTDEHGDWIGLPGGTPFSRPGADYIAPVDQVQLVPPPGPDLERAWMAAFHTTGGPVRVYIDMTTPPVWDGAVLRAVDLDLDVVQGTTGRVWVDDEDEFAEHRVRYGYPDEIAQLAMQSCDRVRTAVTAGDPPYDDSSVRWFERLTAILG